MRALPLMQSACGPLLLVAPRSALPPLPSLSLRYHPPPPSPTHPPHPTSPLLLCVGRSTIGEIAIVDTDFGTHLIKVLERSDKFDPKKTKTDGGYSL